MLRILSSLHELNFAQLMSVYEEGNRVNAEKFYPNLDKQAAILEAEQDFYQYLRDVFFTTSGAFYCVWEVEGRYVSALRIEPYRDGLLLEALETVPDCRRCGYAAALICAVQKHLTSQGNSVVYSHVEKENNASLAAHFCCGFVKISDSAVYIDNTVTHRSCTLSWKC